MQKWGGFVLVLVSFMGTGKYSRVKYYLGSKDNYFETSFVSRALGEFFNPDKWLVITTEEGMKNLESLKREAQDEKIQAIKISIPREERDVWEILDKLNDNLEQGDEVILDITHAFRHIPFLSFVIMTYLQVARGIKIRGIYYGAYESRDGDYVPIFDLSDALVFSEWIYSARDLKDYGRNEGISSIMKEWQNQMYARESKPSMRYTKKYANMLERISRGIYLNQIRDVMKYAYNLSKLSPDVKEELEKYFKPLTLLYRDFTIFEKFGCEDCYDKLSKETLRKQLLIAEYQTGIGLLGESLENLREWIVNFVFYLSNFDNSLWLERENRIEVEKGITGMAMEKRGEKIEKNGVYYYLRSNVDEIERKSGVNLITLWNLITSKRNLIAHSGMSKDSLNLEELKNSTKSILKDCSTLIKYLEDWK
ncbi:CRISPR-associated protein, TM1812 family [Aciduliprofundum boonei T469]|uniref:CRISPR-associated protein, TM1812 family n=1 Tax=Aciduliprofundum boonei (strain DSM 19572 / T469) TaxID=439481 RepID=D3T9Q3_ACIB4|nr:CRISPR-associated protein, TM1812 family [Aciduliprofundum boonei T469]